jgi:hypothetical protein
LFFLLVIVHIAVYYGNALVFRQLFIFKALVVLQEKSPQQESEKYRRWLLQIAEMMLREISPMSLLSFGKSKAKEEVVQALRDLAIVLQIGVQHVVKYYHAETREGHCAILRHVYLMTCCHKSPYFNKKSLLCGWVLMDITVAYFHPFFHPEVTRRDFEQIRAAGATTIVFAVHEQEEMRYSRDLERGLRQAQEAGLKIHLSLGRFGNLFAGPSLMPSWYTFRHPQSRVQDRHGRSHGISCFNHESFRSWLFGEIEYYISTYPINGIILDEPRGPDITCFCSVCRALCPDIADLQHFRRRSFIDFLGELFSRVKRTNPNIKTSLVLLPQDLSLAEELAQIPALDMLGCHLFWQLLNEDVAKVKEWGQILLAGARLHQKRSQLWLQNFSLNEQDEETLEQAFQDLVDMEPDELACYYYWRNNANPEQVWEKTRSLLRRTPRRQLYWDTQARVPVLKIPIRNV